MAFKYKGLRLKDPSLMKKLRQVPLTFTRASVAYDYKGDAVGVDTPRFQHLINGVMEYGCLIEEAHTNILPASQSQSLSEAYTTAALNGTYTFQCEGTGSYELSGGATGTVSKDNPVTAAMSSATVTLTPTGTSTLNQILNKEYPLSYTLGGTTQAAERLQLPISTINLQKATIEIEAYLPSSSAKTGAIAVIWRFAGGNGYGYLRIGNPTNLSARLDDGAGNGMTILKTITYTNGFHKITTNWDNTDLNLFYDAAKHDTPGTGALPSFPIIAADLASNTGTSQHLNGIIKNVCISQIKRADSDCDIRSKQNTPSVDKEIKLIIPLIRDLKAYRVRT